MPPSVRALPPSRAMAPLGTAELVKPAALASPNDPNWPEGTRALPFEVDGIPLVGLQVDFPYGIGVGRGVFILEGAVAGDV